MKCKMMASAFALGFALIVSAATACPAHEKKADESTTKLIKANDKAPCGAKIVAGKSPCSAAKSAVTVAAKAGCGKDCDKPCCAKAAKASAKAKDGCSKPCGAKTATTVAAKAGCGKNCDKPCCADAAKASAKAKGGCSKPCGGKSAATASGKSPCSGKSATTASADNGCPITRKVNAVLASMPAMQYRVGDKTIGCSKSAAAMAEKSGKAMKFVVGDDVLDGEGEAISKLAEMLEKHAASLASIQYVADGKCGACPMTAKSNAKKSGTKMTYRVGGIDFSSKESANKALEAVTAALASVKMEYKVDGKKFGCSKMAGSKCKDSGKSMTYVVGGEETGCSIAAKRMLATAKVRKIVETAVQASFSL